ncbi:uncharacterized protein nuggc.L isoform X2 [Xenopus laevis]|uniref:Uncharacterized protein nuggc.L isoform X2 n=1 Tax=Xenopus laevis TaxID=8355 RepID=A0A8J0VKX1_XENLA|nr:uncharacterized protein nuggc.L isoform X2 [Xenopus laevis]
MSEQTMHNVYRAPGFHLRRIGRRGSQPDALNYIHFLKPVTLIGRNRNVVDHFATAQDSYGRRYISRVHARVICTSIPMSFKLLDSSLTGVYVNDVRIEAEHFLHEGDTVTFGHPEGANICPGTRARQPNSELYFLFEHCHCTMEQLSSDGSPEMQEFAVSPSLNLTEANMHAQVDNGMTTESNISRSPTCTSHPRNVFEEQKEEAEPSISMGAPNYHSSPPEYTSIESIMDRSMIEPSSKETSNISLHSSKSWDSDEEGSYQSEEGNTLKRKCSAQVPEFSVTDPYCEIGANDSSCDGIESEYGDVTSPCHLLQHREDEFCEKQDDERIENQSVVKCDASPRVWPESDKSLSVYATSEHTADTSDSPVAHMLLQLDTNKENQATGCISASVCLVSSEKPLQAQVISFEKSKESCCTEKSLHKYKDSPPLPTCNLSSMIKEDVELNKRHKNAEIANSGSVSPAVIPLRTVMSSEPCTVVKEPQDKTTGEHIEFVSIDDSVSREAEDLNLCSAVGKSIDKKQMQMDPCEQAVMHMESNGSENKLSIGQAECGENRVPNESLGVCHSRNVKEAVPPRENDSAMVMRETRCGSGSPPSLQLVQCREEGPLQATANVLLQKDTNEKAERDVKVEQINLNGVYNSATNNNDELYTLNDPQTGILLSEQKQQHKKPSDGHTEEHSFDFQIVNVCSLSPSIKLQTLDQNNGSTKSIGSENVCVGSTEDKFIGGQDLVEARNCGKMVDTDKQVCVLSQDSNTMRVQNSETVTCPHDIAADPLHTIGSGGYNLVPASVQDSSFPEPIASSDLHNDMEGDNRNSLGLKRCFHDTGSRLSSEKEVPPKKCRTWHEESHETSAIGAHGANIGNILQQFITAHQTVRQADSREVTACAQNQHLIAQITCNFFKSLETVCLSQAQPFSLTHTEIPVEAQSVSETLMSHYIADATQSAPYITEQTQSVFVAHSASHITEETQSISLTHTASDILKQTQFVRVAHTVPHITDETQSVSVAHTVPYITEEAQCVSVAHSDNFIIEEKQSVTVAHTVSHITEEAQCVSVAHMTSDTDEAQSVSMVHLTPDIPEETQYIADEAQSISVTHVAANTDETLSVSVTDIAHHIAEEISVSVAHLDPLITDEIQSVSVTHMAPDTDEIQSVSVTDITPDIAEEINPFITGETQSVCVAHSIPNITEKAQSAHVAHLASEIPEEIQPVSDPFIADEAQSISVTDLAPDIAEEEKFVSVAHSDLFITEETQSVSAAHLDPLITDATQSFSVTPIVPNAEEVESVSVTDIAPDIAEEINPFITDGTQSVCVAHSIPYITEEAQSALVADLDPLITDATQSISVAHLASDIPEETQHVSVAHSDAFITDERQSVSVTHMAPNTDTTQSVSVTDITPDIAEEINPFIKDETQSVRVTHSVPRITEEAHSVLVAHLDPLITDEAQYASVSLLDPLITDEAQYDSVALLDPLITDEAQYASVAHLASEIPEETQSVSVAHSDPFIADEAQSISVTHMAPNRDETQSVSVTGIAPNIAEEVKSVSVAHLDPLITDEIQSVTPMALNSEEAQSVSLTEMVPDITEEIQTVNVAHSDPYITEQTQSVSVTHTIVESMKHVRVIHTAPNIEEEKSSAGVAHSSYDSSEDTQSFSVTDTDPNISGTVIYTAPDTTEQAQSVSLTHFAPDIAENTQSVSVKHMAPDIAKNTQSVSVTHSAPDISENTQSVSVTHSAPDISENTQSDSVTHTTADNGNTVRAWYSHIREEHKQKISYNLQLSSGNCASVHLSPDITRTMESGANTNHTAELGIQGINASNSSTCTLGVASEVPSVSHASNSDQPTLVIVAETDASATGSLGSKKQSFSDCDNTFSSKGTGPRSSSPENINTSEWRCVSPDYSPQGHGRTAHSHQEAFSKELGLLLPAVKASTEPVPRMMAIKSKTTHNSQCISECRPCNVTPTGNNVMMGDLSSPSTFAYHTSQTQPVIKEEGDEYNVASSAKVSSPTDQRFLGQVQGAMYIASSSESLQTISPCRTQHTDTEVIVISDSDEEKPFVNSELRAMFEKDLPKMSLKRKRKTQRPDISEYDRTEMVCGKSENLAPYFDSRAIIVIDSDDNNEVDVKEEEDVDTDYGVQVSSEQYRLKESKEHSWPQPDSWESPNVSAESGVAISPFSGAHSPVFPSLYNAQPASSSFVNMTPPVPPKSISNISLEENLPLPSPFSDDFDILPSDSDLEKIYSDEENASKDSGLSQVMAPPLQFLKYPETQKKTITSSSGESSSETLNVNFKRSEEQQCAWARSEHDVRFQLSECQSVLREVSQVLSDIQGIDEHTMEQWRKGILDLQKESPLPQTHIAVVGDTGAGKSSLLNALLEQEDVLPTSAMRACTAVVVEIEKSSVIGYKADVEFFSKEEWERELKALITDMKDKSGHFKRRPDNKPETRVAHSRVMAVYGKIAELHELKNDTTVTKYLGEKKQISENTASAFRSAIEKYIDTNSEQPRQKKGGQFWPIVKCVRIFVPEAEVLRTGAVLVDLPGTRDSNAARDRIAKEYLQKCDVVWVVTNITRAVDDKTAKEILTSNMRRQLFMDGHYESMAVICTKTDLYNTQEIKRALNLHDETSNLEDTVVRLGHRLNTLEAEKKTLYEQWDKGETFAAENDPRNEILAKEKEISFLKQQKEESLRNINLICVRARNNYSKQRICHDFYQSRQELIKGEDEADGEVEDEEESDAESNMDEELSEDHRLRVFTVSSKEYLDLRRRSVLEGSARLFNSERDTEIPDLRDYAIETALRCSMLAAERVIRNTACIISQVITYLLNRKAQDESDQEKIKLVVEKCLDDLQGQLREAVSVCNRQMTFFIQEKIRQSLAVGVSCAEKSCENIVKRWGFRQSGGYTYPTYKATCVRQGFYSSPACGVIDFNEQLSQPITSAITKSWSEVFSGELVESLSQFNQSVPKLLVRFFKNMRSELFSLGTSYEMIAFIEKQQLKSTQAELLNFFVDQKEYISRRQRHISRLLTPEVQKRMIEVYNECQSVRGEGSFEKMKHLMFSHVKEKKHQIFREAADSLMEQLNFLQTYIRDSLNNFVKERLHSLRQQCEPLLQPMKKEEGILPDLRNLWSHVSQICQRSQVDFHLPELEITPKPEPCDQESRAPNRVEPPEITCLCKVVKVGENHILNCNTIKISAKGVELVWTESPLFVPFSSVRHFEFCSVLYFLTLHLSPDFAWMFQKSTFQTADTDNKLLLLLETPSNTQALNKMMDFLSWRQQGTGWYREVDLHEGRRTLEKMRVYYTEKQEPKQEVDMDHLFLNPAPSSSTMPPSFLGVSQLSVSRKRGSLSPHQGVVEKKPHVLTNPTQQEPRTFPSWPGLHHRTLYPPFPRSPKPNPES